MFQEIITTTFKEEKCMISSGTGLQLQIIDFTLPGNEFFIIATRS